MANEKFVETVSSVAPQDNPSQGGLLRGRSLRRFAWLPIAAFVVGMPALRAADLPGSYDSPYLLLTINFVFSMLVSLFVAYLLARSFLVRGTLGLLIFGGGVLIWGAAGVGAAVAGLAGLPRRDFVDVASTINSSCAWLSAVCYAAGTLLWLRSRRAVRTPGLWLAATYAIALAAVGLIILATLADWTPTFFVQGQGSTLLRQLVLGSAIVLFLSTAAQLWLTGRRSASSFPYWYALALLLIAIGMLGGLATSDYGSLLSWTGRIALFLSGGYMLIAAIASVRESHVWGIPLEAELSEARQQYRTLVDMCPDAIAVHADGKYVFVNPAALRLFGATRPEQIVGHEMLRLTHPDDRETLAAHLHQSAREGQAIPTRQFKVLRLDGRPVDVEATGDGIRFRGRPAVQVVLRDISERKRIEEALRQSSEQLKRAQEIARLGSWELDLVNDRLSWSDEVYRIFGLEPQEFGATYEAFLEAVHPEDRAAVDAAYSGSLLEGQNSYEIEHRVVQKGTGAVRVVYEKCEHFRDASGYIVRSVGMVHDITERKEAEQAFRRAHDLLEQRVQERTAELSRTVDILQLEVTGRIEAEQSLRERSEQLQALAAELTLAEQRERRRLAQVLHDGLQQLLAAAKLRLEILGRTPDAETREAARKVNHLISDSIEMSRSLTAELSPPILHEGGLILALEWLARWMQDKHGLAVDLDAQSGLELIAQDVTILLFQATRELLFNVIKHAGVKSARVQVARHDGVVGVTVVDEGAGFDPAHLRAEGGPSEGFGLFSIRERLDFLGGRMEIDSVPGRGSRFTLIAPLPTLASSSASALRQPKVSVVIASSGETPDATEGRIRVVLVDDHIVMRQGLATLLREEPDMAIVGEASDGESAVKLVRQVRPDVVLMDISMPGMNGIEATRIIHAEMPEVRVIGLSMFEQAERADAMRQAGAVHYLTKSGPSGTLVDTIRACRRASASVPFVSLEPNADYRQVPHL